MFSAFLNAVVHRCYDWLFGYQKGHTTCHTYLTGPVEHNNVNGVDRQQYEKSRKCKGRSVTGLSQVPTPSRSFLCISWQKCIFIVILILLFSEASLICQLASIQGLENRIKKERYSLNKVDNTTFQKRISPPASPRVFWRYTLQERGRQQ